MNTEKIKNLVNNSDLPQLQRDLLNGFIERISEEQKLKREDRLLIEQVAREGKLSEVVVSTNDLKIYTVYGKDDWDVKYPYRVIFLNEKGAWQRCNTVCPSLDTAYLVYLQYKYCGLNSQFSDFAMKMLGIKINE